MYMAYASFFVLGTVCLLCVVVYVAVVGIFILSGGEEATPARRLPAAIVSDLRTLVREPAGLGLLVVFAERLVGVNRLVHMVAAGAGAGSGRGVPGPAAGS